MSAYLQYFLFGLIFLSFGLVLLDPRFLRRRAVCRRCKQDIEEEELKQIALEVDRESFMHP